MKPIKSKYFTVKELACRCGCGGQPNQAFVNTLDAIREAYGHPIEVTSGFRCSTYNRKIGGARFSAHTDGIGADLVRTPALLEFVRNNLDKFNIWLEHPDKTPTWLHVDQRYRPVGRIFQP